MNELIIKILIFILSPIGKIWGILEKISEQLWDIEFIKLRKEKPPAEAEEKEEN